MKKFVYPMLILGFVLFSLAPTFYELSRKGDLRPDRSFELVHNFPTDYNFYLSRIKQGMEGRWTVVERYTAEPHNGSFIHGFYLLLGRIGRYAGVPIGREADVYHVARVVLGVALLVAIAEFCKGAMGAKGAWGVLAFLLAVTASSFPKLVEINGAMRFGGYMAWWSVMDSLQRITFIPHILAGQTLIVWLIGVLGDIGVLREGRNLVFLGVLAFVLGMVFPPGLVFMIGVVGVYIVLISAQDDNSATGVRIFFDRVYQALRSASSAPGDKNFLGTAIRFHPAKILSPVASLYSKIPPRAFFLESTRDFFDSILPYGAVFLMGSAALLYLALMTSFYPWKRLAQVDIIRPLPFDYIEYAKAVGVVGVLGVIGGIWVMIKRERLLYPAVAWVIAWIGFLVVFRFVPQQSPLRFSEMLPHVPLAVLSAYVLSRLGHLRDLRILSKIAVITLISLGIFHMYSSYLWQKDFVDHKIRATLPLVPTGSFVMYPLNDFLSAMDYLWDVTKGQGIILSETTAGNYIPARTGNTVYMGHDNTVAFEEKKIWVKQFFAGKMNKEWLKSTGASYIFFGPQEREDAGGKNLTTFYPFLTEIYKNAHVTIYATN